MTFLEVRNTLVSSLAVALGIPVLLSDQVQPEAEVPFIVYSITAPYASTGELGDHTQTVIEDEDGWCEENTEYRVLRDYGWDSVKLALSTNRRIELETPLEVPLF